MTRQEALSFVQNEIDRLEKANEGKELRPWERDACPAANEHWHRIQQRIYLKSNGLRGPTHSCDELHISYPVSEKQRAALDVGRIFARKP